MIPDRHLALKVRTGSSSLLPGLALKMLGCGLTAICCHRQRHCRNETQDRQLMRILTKLKDAYSIMLVGHRDTNMCGQIPPRSSPTDASLSMRPSAA